MFVCGGDVSVLGSCETWKGVEVLRMCNVPEGRWWLVAVWIM